MVEHEGMAQVKMKVNNKTIVTEIYVTKKRTVPILTSLQLGLMKPGENAENVNVNTLHTEVSQSLLWSHLITDVLVVLVRILENIIYS